MKTFGFGTEITRTIPTSILMLVDGDFVPHQRLDDVLVLHPRRVDRAWDDVLQNEAGQLHAVTLQVLQNVDTEVGECPENKKSKSGFV